MGISWHRALGTDVGQAHVGGLGAELGERFVPVPWSVVMFVWLKGYERGIFEGREGGVEGR